MFAHVFSTHHIIGKRETEKTYKAVVLNPIKSNVTTRNPKGKTASKKETVKK